MTMSQLAAPRPLHVRLLVGAAVLCTALALTACGATGTAAVAGGSSAGGSSAGGSSGAPGVSANTITIGYIADESGPISSLTGQGVQGAEARIALQNAQGGVDGRKLVLKVQDTQSSPTNVLTNAQTLVSEDHVFSVVEFSCVFAGAAPYLTQQGVPVVSGQPCDGYEWADHSNTNMVVAAGANGAQASSAYQATVLKRAGVTKLALVTASAPAAATGAARSIAKAATAAGIKVVYMNTSETTPATALGSVAVAIQRAGANGLSVNLPRNADNLSLFAALKAQGVHLVEYAPAGYTPAFLTVPSNRAALEGEITTFPWAPPLVNSAATKTFVAALEKYEPSAGDPGPGGYDGWIGADLTIQGLLKAGKNVTRKSFLDALHGMTNYTAGGLSPGPVDLSVAKMGTYELVSSGNCGYALTVQGGHYQLLPGNPVCGPPSSN